MDDATGLLLDKQVLVPVAINIRELRTWNIESTPERHAERYALLSTDLEGRDFLDEPWRKSGRVALHLDGIGRSTTGNQQYGPGNEEWESNHRISAH
jgi:hypothetical protein